MGAVGTRQGQRGRGGEGAGGPVLRRGSRPRRGRSSREAGERPARKGEDAPGPGRRGAGHPCPDAHPGSGARRRTARTGADPGAAASGAQVLRAGCAVPGLGPQAGRGGRSGRHLQDHARGLPHGAGLLVDPGRACPRRRRSHPAGLAGGGARSGRPALRPRRRRRADRRPGGPAAPKGGAAAKPASPQRAGGGRPGPAGPDRPGGETSWRAHRGRGPRGHARVPVRRPGGDPGPLRHRRGPWTQGPAGSVTPADRHAAHRPGVLPEGPGPCRVRRRPCPGAPGPACGRAGLAWHGLGRSTHRKGGPVTRDRKALLVLGVLSALASSHVAWAHPGRTNSSGCHNERRTGGYHCHGGGGSRPCVVRCDNRSCWS
ncbi:MAG: YHYH domain-containing protein, partial [Myxococcaceae bacterium]